MPKQPSPPPPLATEDQPCIINSTRTPPRILKKRPVVSPPDVPDKQTLPTTDIHLLYYQFIKNQDRQESYFDNEHISSLQFNSEGNLLAIGDRGGRVKVFKRDAKFKSANYDHYVTFQSHVPEFDYLKSVEIEEKIIQLKWLNSNNPANHLLSANDRTIKLWRIGDEKKLEYVPSRSSPAVDVTRLILPKRMKTTSTLSSNLRKSFHNGHTFHINSVSVNSDGETFLSSDDLRINVWSIDHTDQSFVIVDMKPENMENLNEVITSCSFHPKSCNIFCYSTSKGITNMCDMRVNANCDRPLRYFKYDDSGYRGFFSEIVASISDAQFSNSGTYLATRDYLGVKIWDTRMDSQCLVNYPVQEYIRPFFHSMFESDLIFDKFTLSWSFNDRRILTGSYNDLFSVADPNVYEHTYKSTLFQISDEYKDSKHHVLKGKRVLPAGVDVRNPLEDIKFEDMDVQKRVLLSQWHPKENLVAVASTSNVSLFTEKRLFF